MLVNPCRESKHRSLRRLFAGWRCLPVCLALAAPACAQTFSIQPNRSFLRAGSETPPAAHVLTLQDIGFQPGDGMRLERLGDYRPGSPFQDTSVGMIAVFSSSSVLLAATELRRVPGALDAGIDIVTAKTYHGSLDTDIPEDFAVVNPVVQVPAGATHVFVAASDSLYNDNSDPDSDFAVRISRAILPEQVASGLRIWAGLQTASDQDVVGYDAVTGAPFSGIDIRDAVRLARRFAGTEP